jgi:1-deoxy-D-xylulose-5-phosphate synthase
MGLYDIAYMLAVPGMTVTAPRDGTEMLGLLRAASLHETGPFCIRYPRDASPDTVPEMSAIEPVPYGSWEILRKGSGARDPNGGLAILATGTMVLPSVAAAEKLAEEGINATVVNCRFIKPHDEKTLAAIVADNKDILVVEEGTVVNGFGAHMAAVIAQMDPAVRVIAHGVPDKFIEQAPRARQLSIVGLDAPGIAARAKQIRHLDARGARLRAG